MLHSSTPCPLAPLASVLCALLVLAVLQFSWEGPPRKYVVTRCWWLISEKGDLTDPKEFPYYKCLFHQNGSSTFYSYACPEGTCFDFLHKVCSNMACITTSTNLTSLLPEGYRQTPFINLGSQDRDLHEGNKTTPAPALQNITDDHPGNWPVSTGSMPPVGGRLYNDSVQTGKSSRGEESTLPRVIEGHQGDLPNKTENVEPQKNLYGDIRHQLEDLEGSPTIHSSSANTSVVAERKDPPSSWNSTSPHYNCTRRRYKCTERGLYADPEDRTIFYRCAFHPVKMKWRSTCFPCNERFDKCFSPVNEACVDCGDVGTYREYTTSVISETTSYDCVGYKHFPCSKMGYGLHEHPGDKSIAVHCTNDTLEMGEWMGGCITCSRNTWGCFIEGIEQCIENCVGGRIHPYNCSHYKLTKKDSCPAPGKFATPLDNTTYYECAAAGTTPTCRPCARGAFFSSRKEECVSDIQLQAKLFQELATTVAPLLTIPPGSYDCQRYHQFLFNCRYPGYFADPHDTSVYFSCIPTPTGGFVSFCHTCNKLHKTCFDDLQKACVTLGKGSSCGTSVQLQSIPLKGTPGSSKTYSCRGYNNLSFPCASVEAGYYALPGDPSVYVHCEDTNGDTIAEWESCHTCSQETWGCFNDNLRKCVHYCASGDTNHSEVEPGPEVKEGVHVEIAVMPQVMKLGLPLQKKEMAPWILMLDTLSYDCTQVGYTCREAGSFVNATDPSVWFECGRGKRANDWTVRCRVCPREHCFDGETRGCTVTCRKHSDDWKFTMCRDKWTYLCDLLGIG